MATTEIALVEADEHDDHHDELPAAVLPRRRNVQVGTAFGTGALCMYFGALFAIYLSERADHLATQELVGGDAPWIPRNVQVELTAPTIMAWTLLMSIITMQWAVYSAKRDDRTHTLLGLLVTFMFGIAVINQTVFQWNQLGIVADSPSRAAPLIYAITASFVVALVASLIFLFVMGFRAMSGASTSQNVDGIASAAVLWYALVAIYFIIWILVFITK